MFRIHRTCYWHYFYGDEFQACEACRNELLGDEERFCFGSYARDANYTPLPLPYCRDCCSSPCRSPFHCAWKAWIALFYRSKHDDGVASHLIGKMSQLEFNEIYSEGYWVAYRITGNDADAHDAVQTALFKMHRHLDSPEQMRAWFLCSVRNAALDIVRKRKRHVPIDEECLPTIERDSSDGIDATLLSALPEAMSKLSKSDQKILRMHYVDGLSHSEIAKRLKVPVTTVNNRLSTARRRLHFELRKIMEREGLAVA